MNEEPTRKGKIARLPAEIRAEVNRRLHDGQPAAKIIEWLHTLPEVLNVLDEHFREQPISEQNLSEWKGGGYRDWKARQDKVANLKDLSSYAFDLAKAGGSVSDGAAAVAGGRLLEALETADEETLVGFTLALSKLKDSEAKSLAARTGEANLARKDRQLDLETAKFQRGTAELYLKWVNSPEAQAIVNGGEPKRVKMDKLVQLMFGDRPD